MTGSAAAAFGAPILSLAGIGPELTRIKIYAVPGLARNVRRRRLGRPHEREENEETNRHRPAIALWRDLGSPVRVGT